MRGAIAGAVATASVNWRALPGGGPIKRGVGIE